MSHEITIVFSDLEWKALQHAHSDPEASLNKFLVRAKESAIKLLLEKYTDKRIPVKYSDKAALAEREVTLEQVEHFDTWKQRELAEESPI